MRRVVSVWFLPCLFMAAVVSAVPQFHRYQVSLGTPPSPAHGSLRAQDLDTVSLGELLFLIKRKNVMLVDVRPSRAYRLGHIPGAQSVLLDQLKGLTKSLGRPDVPVFIVVYGAAQEDIKAAWGSLMDASLARYYDGGISEWQMAGFPLEVGL